MDLNTFMIDTRHIYNPQDLVTDHAVTMRHKASGLRNCVLSNIYIYDLNTLMHFKYPWKHNKYNVDSIHVCKRIIC